MKYFLLVAVVIILLSACDNKKKQDLPKKDSTNHKIDLADTTSARADSTANSPRLD